MLRLFLISFRRYFGIVLTHYQVAIYTARRSEMIDVVHAFLFYLNPERPIPVHSPYSSLPYQVTVTVVNYGSFVACFDSLLAVFCEDTPLSCIACIVFLFYGYFLFFIVFLTCP